MNQRIKLKWYSPFLILITTFVLSLTILKAEEHNYTIMSIDDFNDDMSIDTLIGKSINNGVYFPTKIVWGFDSIVHPDPLIYPKVSETSFNYPNWNNLRINSLKKCFNNDSINDLIIFISGGIPIDSTTMKDTSVALILFGQCGLDTIESINIPTISYNQVFPFKARKLAHPYDFSDCFLRNGETKTFFRINQVSDVLNPPPMYKHGSNCCGGKSKYDMKLYPIPSIEKLTIELNNFEEGIYIIKLLDLEGRVLLTKQVNVNSNQTNEIIETSLFLNGSYLIVIEKESITIFSKSLIIHR